MKKVKFCTLKTEIFSQNLTVGYVYIEESFDTISIWVMGMGRTAPLPMGFGSKKSPMVERVKL